MNRIGAAEGCWLQLQDQAARVSRQHAMLTYDNGRWTAADLRSKNGIYQDRARRASVLLAPGVELGIGGTTLIAESPRLGALRELLARLLGWADERRADVDLALRSVRMAATRRESLQLCGDGDLVAIAQLMHRHTLGDARPFVVCDPLRRRDAYAADAGAAPDGTLTLADRAWVRQHEAGTLARIEKATRRLVAIRNAGGSITRAAARLGMAHGALSEWIARRMLEIDEDVTANPSRDRT